MSEHHGPRIVPRHAWAAKLLTEPYELLVSAGLVLYAVTMLSTRQVPPSLLRVAPRATILVWAALLGLTGVLVIVGMFRSKRLELAGNLMLGGLVLAYAVTVILELGLTGIAGAAFSGPIGLAALTTARRIIVAERVAKVIDDAE